MLCSSRLVAVGRVQTLDLLLLAPFPPIYQRHQSVDVLSSVLGWISAHQVVGQLFYNLSGTNHVEQHLRLAVGRRLGIRTFLIGSTHWDAPRGVGSWHHALQIETDVIKDGVIVDA